MADPKAMGVISGLTLHASPEDLALLYLATVQSIAYGTKHIVDHCNAHGLKVNIYAFVSSPYLIQLFVFCGKMKVNDHIRHFALTPL